MAQRVKRLPTTQETWVWSLGREDPPEKEMATHSNTLAWKILARTDAEGETPILWPPDAKSWLIWKDPDAGKDWRREEKGSAEDEMVGWHHWPDGHEFKQAPGIGDGQGSLACCSPWGRKESDTTEQLNWTDYIKQINNRALLYSRGNSTEYSVMTYMGKECQKQWICHTALQRKLSWHCKSATFQ